MNAQYSDVSLCQEGYYTDECFHDFPINDERIN